MGFDEPGHHIFMGFAPKVTLRSDFKRKFQGENLFISVTMQSNGKINPKYVVKRFS